MKKIITNKVYDKLSNAIDDYFMEELGITYDGSKSVEIMMIIFNHLGLEKE